MATKSSMTQSEGSNLVIEIRELLRIIKLTNGELEILENLRTLIYERLDQWRENNDN